MTKAEERKNEAALKRLLEEVEKNGQVRVADWLGVHQTTVSKWVNGTRPSRMAFKAIRQVYGAR